MSRVLPRKSAQNGTQHNSGTPSLPVVTAFTGNPLPTRYG